LDFKIGVNVAGIQILSIKRFFIKTVNIEEGLSGRVSVRDKANEKNKNGDGELSSVPPV
jgi:hypothetical protein